MKLTRGQDKVCRYEVTILIVKSTYVYFTFPDLQFYILCKIQMRYKKRVDFVEKSHP